MTRSVPLHGAGFFFFFLYLRNPVTYFGPNPGFSIKLSFRPKWLKLLRNSEEPFTHVNYGISISFPAAPSTDWTLLWSTLLRHWWWMEQDRALWICYLPHWVRAGIFQGIKTVGIMTVWGNLFSIGSSTWFVLFYTINYACLYTVFIYLTMCP